MKQLPIIAIDEINLKLLTASNYQISNILQIY